MKRLEFIAAIDVTCREVEKTWGIPHGWLKAQAIQESGGYGTSDLSINAKNLFGIKGHDYYQGATGYAKFASWEDAIRYQGWQLNQKLYLPFKSLAQEGKYREYGDEIQKAGYCYLKKGASPDYGTKIAEIATQYDLFPDPKSKLSPAQQWAIDNKIIDDPADWDKPVDMNTLAWALYKSRGKI
jgi:flagellum-specific peptidoglycan hydrolase FlgJ